MQTLHQAHDASEIHSPAEEAFNRKRRTIGLFLAPLAFVAVLAFPFHHTVSAHRTAAMLMMRHGVTLDIVGSSAIVGLVLGLGPIIF